MLDIVLPIVLLSGLVVTVVLSRTPAIGAALVAVGFGISGSLLQFLGVRGVDFTFRAVQAWLIATEVLLVVASVVLRSKQDAKVVSSRAKSWPWIIAALSTVLFAASRALAPLDPAPLSSVGYLVSRVSAEDNAKWVNASARLASEMPLDTWASVGGPIVLLLTLSASIIAGASQILYGGVNEVAVSAGGPILAQHLLIIATPFALTPLIATAARVRGIRQVLPTYLFVVGAGILWLVMTVLLAVGHLTLQYTLLVLTFWVAAFLRPFGIVRTLGSLSAATLAMVWFPLSPVSLVIILVGLAIGIRALIRGRARTFGIGMIASFAAVAVLLFEFLRSSITYSLGITAQVSGDTSGGAGAVSTLSFPTLPLFNDPGGTEEITAVLLALTALGVLGTVYTFSSWRQSQRRTLIALSPILLLAAFSSAVMMLDFWVVGDGPGYGASKVTFACLIPILVSTLPIAVWGTTPSGEEGSPLRVGLVAVVFVLVTWDTLLPRAAMQLKPSLWPSTSTNAYWSPAEVRPTAKQPLTANPIACIFLSPGSSAPSALPWGQTAYSCTRLLTATAGMERDAAVITEWLLTEWIQDRSLWDRYHGYISTRPQDVKNRSVILMDDEKDVNGLDSISYLLGRYPPSQPVS